MKTARRKKINQEKSQTKRKGRKKLNPKEKI